jgi:uncharacterized protein YutE (UPF0331/DUF86 family)
MDKLRKLRYEEKIELISDRIAHFDINPQTKIEKWGLFYAIQTSIETVFDLIAMLIKDMGIVVKDDEDNVMRIVEERELDTSLGQQLKAAKGMRNVIVHQYNEINEELIFDSLSELKKLIKQWLNIIQETLNEMERIKN